MLRGFLLGLVATLCVIAVGGYMFIAAGGLPMSASAKPLPLESTVAHFALESSYKNDSGVPNPLSLTEENLVAGAHEYHDHCAMCHGTPGSPSALALEMFPPPPQLLEPKDMVTDDPEGETHWKVTNGIRLSGMPAFEKSLTDTQRWQVTMLLAHADKLPPTVQRIVAEAP